MEPAPWIRPRAVGRHNFSPDKRDITLNESSRDALVRLLNDRPNDPSVAQGIRTVEAEHPANLSQDGSLLAGVWELRWSSASQPWLRQSPWLNNLQILDPSNRRACNLLMLRGPLEALGGISVEAELDAIDTTRVAVRFLRGGWLGPRRPGEQAFKLMRDVKQSFPAWLDITVLDQQLRICRGNAGTTFALLRREDKCIADFLPN